MTSSQSQDAPVDRENLLKDVTNRLKKLGSGPLCDADKAHRQKALSNKNGKEKPYEGLSLMCPITMKLRNPRHLHLQHNPHHPHHQEHHHPGIATPNDILSRAPNPNTMIGTARTLQLTQPNDFLSVLHGLSQLHAHDVLIVNSNGSSRAVAGGLFAMEAARRHVSGIVVDGPVRDVDDLNLHALKHDGSLVNVYSTSVTPYSGTVQHIGEGIDVAPVICGGVRVHPGDIVFGDVDGILVGSLETFAKCLHNAENIVAVEEQLMEGMRTGMGLHSMMNFDEHLDKRRRGNDSTLEFKDLKTVKFRDMDQIHVS